MALISSVQKLGRLGEGVGLVAIVSRSLVPFRPMGTGGPHLVSGLPSPRDDLAYPAHGLRV